MSLSESEIRSKFRQRRKKLIILVFLGCLTVTALVFMEVIFEKRFSESLFCLLLVIAWVSFLGVSSLIVFRCPKCNYALGGNIFAHFCPKCGVQLQG